MNQRLFDIALEGAGTKGIALNAALAEILRRGYGVRRVVGTSAGAIAAAMVAVGCTGDELLAMSTERTFDGRPVFSEYVNEPIIPSSQEEFTEIDLAVLSLPGQLAHHLSTVRAMATFLDHGGLVSGDGFVTWLQRHLESKRPGLSLVTLGELYAESATHLTIIATDTTSRKIRALNHVTAARCPLIAALRMSMSIPFLFAEVVWRKEWGEYAGEDLEGHVLVDGSVLSKLPLRFVLPGASAGIEALMGAEPSPAMVLALTMDGSLEVPGAPPVRASAVKDYWLHTRLGRRLASLADTVLNGPDLTMVDTDKHFCRLPAKGYLATEFEMSRERVDALLAAATRATADCLDRIEEGELP